MNEDLASQLSSILQEKNIDLNQLLDNFKNNTSEKNNNTENESSNTSNSTGNQFDAETLFKIQKLFSLLNSQGNSNDETLLKALKPYMRDSRKDKIDQYVKLLHIFKLFEKFQEMGGNLNDFL